MSKRVANSILSGVLKNVRKSVSMTWARGAGPDDAEEGLAMTLGGGAELAEIWVKGWSGPRRLWRVDAEGAALAVTYCGEGLRG
uniref:Uncharacterized protein n=1 Tax=Oryza brachyantha TaxID=4533 RepID=J3NCD5_ORYBR